MTALPQTSRSVTGVDLAAITMGVDPLLAADGLPARKRRRRPEPAPMVLNIVSMIDVIFLLMTYFLLTAKFTTREESFELSVPERIESASTSAPPADPFALPQTPVVITVSSRAESGMGGVLRISSDQPALRIGAQTDDRATYDALADRAAAARGQVLPPDQRFIIRPEAGTRWEHALGVLNALKRAEFHNVRFASPAQIAVPGETR